MTLTNNNNNAVPDNNAGNRTFIRRAVAGTVAAALVAAVIVVAALSSPSSANAPDTDDEPVAARQASQPTRPKTIMTLPAPAASNDSVPPVTAPATTTTVPEPVIDRFSPLTSPDAGDFCADSLDPDAMTRFFAEPIGSFTGADYQRAFRLNDDRVLWVFQDAFISGSLVHNAAMIQSGRCFTLLNNGARSWLLGDITSHMSQWHWIFDGELNADGSQISLYVAQMNETGGSYLSNTTPTLMRRVVVDTTTFQTVEVIEEPATGVDLYGWSVTSDTDYTYLYSHCYRQFGWEYPFGYDPCAVDAKVARVPVGELGSPREYWDGTNWQPSFETAANIVEGAFIVDTVYGMLATDNNPIQVRFDGEQFLLVTMPGDWWGERVFVASSDTPQGPWTVLSDTVVTAKCDESTISGGCNTYWAAWTPWRDSNGQLGWSVGHNVWSGRTTSHMWVYRPTFAAVDVTG